MEPETPSRRKKAGDEPVTIDLEAVPASAETEARTTEETAEADAATADTTGTGTDEAVASEPETREPQDTTEEKPEPVEPARPTYEEPVYTQPATTARRGNAGPLAAGILGGLIALLGAGSLQYGGYLPALGPDRTGDTGALTSLSNEVEALKARLAETPAAGTVDLQPLETRIAALEKGTGETGGATAGNPEAVSKLEGDVTRLTTELTALREAVARTSEAVSSTESQLTERIAAAEQKLDEPRSDVEMARAVAASALKTAIDRGGPYLAELEAFASIAPDDPSVAGLREHAAVGVASRSDLVRDFQPTADAILDAVHQPDGDQGIFNRLMSSAASAIRVRPVGSIEGDTPEAVVARIENKLQNGDFKGAQIEWQTLPEAGQAAAAEYKRKLDTRVTVEDLIGTAVSGAITGTGNGNQG
ncbi:COG4223 family protein [Shinella sp. M31]|uniref:COG4223 family protein n=1 Tax=Shinella sp. M31 TaxID=3368615 RepID=UPI003B9E9CBA